MRVSSLLLSLAVLTVTGCSTDGARGTSVDPNAAAAGAGAAGVSGGTGGASSMTQVAGASGAMTAAIAGSSGAAGLRAPAGQSGSGGMSIAAAGSPTGAGASGSSGPTTGPTDPTRGGGGQTGVMPAAGSGGAAGRASAAGSPAAGSGGSTPGASPVYHIPLRIHMQASKLTNDELKPILSELNSIWLTQGGVCFEIEVTNSETNRTDGFDFRYTAGQIPGASSANGLTQNAHAIWSIDHPRLNAVKMPVKNPAARTTAHELGHALGLDHENPPPSTDCASPCYCAERGDDCDEYLLRSGTQGYFLSPPEIQIARGRAEKVALANRSEPQCGEPIYVR
jgi:hypothetical protein